MRRSRWMLWGATLVALLAVNACAHKVVSRISPDSRTDLSGRWNDTDSRYVSDAMIDDCLGGAWVAAHEQKHDRKPVVIVGRIRNRSEEHIEVGTFVGDIEGAFINSGRVKLVANAEERAQVREERADQQEFASDESMKRWGRERGADYMLGGVVQTIADQERGESVMFYQVDLNLIDLENNEKVWQGQHKIKKYIARRKVRL